jgi:hypothetical protein
MLNLLPGIRDLRAPLAAGYIWLVALWIALEPVVPDEDDAVGVLASFYRLADTVSAIGLGVVASFVAYVLGALSTSVFSSWASHSRVVRALRRTRLCKPFSAQGREALDELARDRRIELESTLSMSGMDVWELLDESRVTEPSKAAGGNPKIYPLRLKKRRLPRPHLSGPGGAEPMDFEAEQQARIASAVTRELDTIATTRLLGRDEALYSAIDRLRSETEFRLAIVPPIVFAGGVLASRIDLPWSVPVILGALVLCYGLLVDAVKLQRRTNERLLDVLADGRVKSPVLERLQSRATAIANRTSADDVEQAASRIAARIGRTIKRLETLGRSEPTLAEEAKRDADVAQHTLDELAPRLPPDVVRPARDAIENLNTASDAWVAAMRGEGFDDGNRLAYDRGVELYKQFLGDAKDAVAQMRSPAKSQ